jgi:hypothetical protein
MVQFSLGGRRSAKALQALWIVADVMAQRYSSGKRLLISVTAWGALADRRRLAIFHVDGVPSDGWFAGHVLRIDLKQRGAGGAFEGRDLCYVRCRTP